MISGSEKKKRETLFDRWNGTYPLCFHSDPKECEKMRKQFLEFLMNTYV